MEGGNQLITIVIERSDRNARVMVRRTRICADPDRGQVPYAKAIYKQQEHQGWYYYYVVIRFFTSDIVNIDVVNKFIKNVEKLRRLFKKIYKESDINVIEEARNLEYNLGIGAGAYHFIEKMMEILEEYMPPWGSPGIRINAMDLGGDYPCAYVKMEYYA